MFKLRLSQARYDIKKQSGDCMTEKIKTNLFES